MEVRLSLSGAIKRDDHEIAIEPTLQLLGGIAETRSLRGAADRLGLSYRAAWSRLQVLEAALGCALVVKTKGHGSSLTPFGESLLGLLHDTQARFAATLASEERQLGERLSALFGQGTEPVRLAASHDPLLMDLLARATGFVVSVTGSEDAVKRLLAGQADAAGFHHGEPATAAAAFPALFADPAFAIHPLYQREQGLIVAPGNPFGIGSVTDIAARGARFVNRQRGSGTRAWFDRLLASSGLGPDAIRGYEVEEFTHQAVAAMVASRAADIGMGVRIAAERLGLDFLPLGEETYYLATRSDHHHPAIAALLSSCSEPITLPGYKPARP